MMSSSESSESGHLVSGTWSPRVLKVYDWGFGSEWVGRRDVDIYTGVDEVVGVVVVADGTGLCLVELRVFDFFELDHGWGSLVRCEVECAIVSEEVGICGCVWWKLFAKRDWCWIVFWRVKAARDIIFYV